MGLTKPLGGWYDACLPQPYSATSSTNDMPTPKGGMMIGILILVMFILAATLSVPKDGDDL